MPITKALAGTFLVLIAVALAPAAQAQQQNDGYGMTSRPSKGVNPAQKADRQAKRKEQRDMQRQQWGSAPPMHSRPPSN